MCPGSRGWSPPASPHACRPRQPALREGEGGSSGQGWGFQPGRDHNKQGCQHHAMRPSYGASPKSRGFCRHAAPQQSLQKAASGQMAAPRARAGAAGGGCGAREEPAPTCHQAQPIEVHVCSAGHRHHSLVLEAVVLQAGKHRQAGGRVRAEQHTVGERQPACGTGEAAAELWQRGRCSMR